MRKVVGFALFVGIVISLVGVGTAAGAATRVPMADLSRKQQDLEVFMEVRATKTEIHAVERAIRSSPQVRRYVHVDEAGAYREFRRIFVHDPRLIAATRASDLPDSFRLDLHEGVDAGDFASAMRRFAGVDSAALNSKPVTESDALDFVRHCQVNGSADIEVFMDLGATDAQVAGVEALVTGSQNMRITRVLSHDDAYAEFTRMYESRPDVLSRVRPLDLPISVRVAVDGGASEVDAFELRQLPGVDNVDLPARSCAYALALLANGLSPEQAAHAVVQRSKDQPG